MVDDALNIKKSGTTVTTGASSVAVVLPSASGETTVLGPSLRYVRVVALSGGAFVKFGPSGLTATSNDILITTIPQVFNVMGCTHFAHIQANTTATLLSVTPVEG